MEIIGLRIEKYIDKRVEGHNCDFKYIDDVFEKTILCGIDDDNRKVEITLSRSEGQCGSGWCCASFGHKSVEVVENFTHISHYSKKKLIIDDEDAFSSSYEDEDYIENDVFHVSECGGDHYYPSGGYSVDMSLFKHTPRQKEERPI